jgi:hypothetical protein
VCSSHDFKGGGTYITVSYGNRRKAADRAFEHRRSDTTHGRVAAVQQIEASSSDSNHGLSDCAEERDPVVGALEIDALVLAGRQGEATRRYRHLTHTTWDQAVNAVRGWRDNKWAQKLALLGWCPKDKSPSGESPMLDHPLRDRWLDG